MMREWHTWWRRSLSCSVTLCQRLLLSLGGAHKTACWVGFCLRSESMSSRAYAHPGRVWQLGAEHGARWPLVHSKHHLPRLSMLLELRPCALCRFLPGKDPRKLLREEAYTGLLTTAIGIRMSKVAQARSLRTRASRSSV